MFCHMCGSQLPEDSGFCNKCGTKIVHADTAPKTSNPTLPTVEPKAAYIADPSPRVSFTPVQAVAHNPAGDTGFKEFVDNHVRSTTKFKSADDLMKNSKPHRFIWICLGVSFIVGSVLAFPVGGVIFLIFGYAAAFIASGIIRMRYSGRFGGALIGDINTEELITFLDGHLKQIHPYFHKWGYLTKKGLLPILENAIANATNEVRICSEFGPKRKNLVALYIKPKTIDAKPGEKMYYVDALKNGYLMDGRAAGFLGHGTLIRTAPILQAAMEYYNNTQQSAQGGV